MLGTLRKKDSDLTLETLKEIIMKLHRPLRARLSAAILLTGLAFVAVGCAAPAATPAASSATAPATASTPAATQDIIDVAVGAPQFSTLVTAVKAAGLVDTLKGPGPFTVFAPTNEAFAKLPAGTVENLLKPENKAQLVAVLTYHVVPGKVMAADVAGAQVTPATVQGATLAVDGRSGVKVNNATVVAADIAASNGVIHGIDTVLMPPAK
jgi:uncharacterized surface protein with fasciclin (FAS1) repeats